MKNEELHKKIEALSNENKILKDKIAQSQKQKEKILSFGGNLLLGGNLKDSINKLSKEYPSNISRQTIADVLYNLIIRLTRLSIIGFGLAFLPLIILIVQSFIFKKQTDLIEQQNLQIETDLNLSEASRRNSFISSISFIYDILDDNNNYEKDGNLNARTIKKISSILDSYKPYRYYDNGKLTELERSPEKGQIIQILLKENLPLYTLFNIFDNTRLLKTELKDARIKDSYLTHAIMLESDLTLSYFQNVNFERTQLMQSIIKDAKFNECNLIHTNFWESNLESTSMTNSNLLGSILLDCNLKNVDFSNSLLVYAKVDSSDMTGAILKNTIVGLPDWFDRAKENGVKGIDNLKKRYEIMQEPIYILKNSIESTYLHIPHEDKSDEGPKLALGTYVTKMMYYVPDTIEGYVIKFKETAYNNN